MVELFTEKKPAIRPMAEAPRPVYKSYAVTANMCHGQAYIMYKYVLVCQCTCQYTP